jgi:hypothetical protein
VPRRNTVVLAVCLGAAVTTLIDQAALNTAIPALRESLGAGPATIQWIVAGYSLTEPSSGRSATRPDGASCCC